MFVYEDLIFLKHAQNVCDIQDVLIYEGDVYALMYLWAYILNRMYHERCIVYMYV